MSRSLIIFLLLLIVFVAGLFYFASAGDEQAVSSVETPVPAERIGQ